MRTPRHRKRRRPMLRFATLLSILLSPSVPGVAAAWGPQGHVIVAEVATMRLGAVARARVAALLGRGESLASVASWADDVRHERPETGRWHFVDIPRGAAGYDAVRDCQATPFGDCVVAAIERFKGILGDAAEPRDRRAEALRFLVHLAGDIHQPLHCADDHDHGGNDVKVTFFRAPTNLHAIWDSAILARAGLAWIDHARQLEGWLESQSVEAVAGGTTVSWAEESHRLAARRAYAIPASRRLGAGYYAVNQPVVDRQLARAGARLARLLNDLLR